MREWVCNVFKATLSDVGLLTDSIATIAELIDEGIFKLGKDGISLVAADRALVAVVNFHMAANAFDTYEVDEEQSIGLNIANLLSVLRRASAGERITLNLKEAKLEITIENASTRRFTVPILDLREEEIPKVEELEKKFTTHAKLRPEVLRSGIEDAELVADNAVFLATPERFEMIAEGDVSSARLELVKGSDALLELGTEGEAKARYAIDYLKRMIKAAKIADVVELDWGQDFPIRMRFSSGDKLSLTMILAPRVMEE
jgi:proliferating cell nuclear antigen